MLIGARANKTPCLPQSNLTQEWIMILSILIADKKYYSIIKYLASIHQWVFGQYNVKQTEMSDVVFRPTVWNSYFNHNVKMKISKSSHAETG